MPRLFTSASSEVISFANTDQAAMSGFAVAAIFRGAVSDGVDRAIFGRGISTSASGLIMRRKTNDTIYCQFSNGSFLGSSSTVVNADGWVFALMAKSPGTTLTSRAHIYKYATRTWVHEDGAQGSGSGADPGASPAQSVLLGARTGSGGVGLYFDGDLAVAGYWSPGVVLTDDQVEPLAFNLNAWRTRIPGGRGLWLLDQGDTGQKVIDLSGTAAHQAGITGTAVSTIAVPHFSRPRSSRS